ncbi:hypothetical protein ACFVVM_16795 [Nocardia sp. NPDC058176]|uniref:hypothetical protein n=1 Tax=Nocardia sp. NPDC058176 TaxID=3346368 RepID=UPI0036D8CF91
MQASLVPVLSLVTAMVVASLTTVTVYVTVQKNRLEKRARGRKSIQRAREKVDEYEAEIKRLDDACPPKLRWEYDYARHLLAAEYAVQVTPGENARQWRFLPQALIPALVLMTGSILFFGDSSTWVVAVAWVVYELSLLWITLNFPNFQSPTWRVHRQRTLYARLGGRALLPQIRPITGNPWVSRVPSRRSVERWITEAIGPQADGTAVTDEHVGAIQASIDQWYLTRRTHRIQQSLAAAGRVVRDHVTDPVRMR